MPEMVNTDVSKQDNKTGKIPGKDNGKNSADGIISPKQVVIFIIMLVLQQFDGLVPGTLLLGHSTGLNHMWLIFAITVGGAYFGVLGMFIGVPVVEVAGFLANKFIKYKLQGRDIKALEENEKWRVGYMTLQMSYQEKFEEGYERGIECGIERGIEQERKELALRMAREGELPAEKIAMYTGLSLKKIKELQEML